MLRLDKTAIGVFILLTIFYIASMFFFERWEKAVFAGGDGWGYYAYLPAAFIYGDLENPVETYRARFPYQEKIGVYTDPNVPTETYQADNGNYIIKYTVGVAILQAPFFAIAHAWASMSDYPADGYSFPYIFMVHIAGLFYALLGLMILYGLLKKWFNPRQSLWTILALALGTNLYFFSVYNSPLSHTYLFFLYVVLMWGTVYFYEKASFKTAIFIGISAGLITLIRPVEMICLIIPILYGVFDKTTLRQRRRFIEIHWKKYLLAVLVYGVMALPQLLIWKTASGNFLFYSYGSEGFDFAHPHIFRGLFGYMNGWLIYTPIMAFAVLGVFLLRKRLKEWFLPIAIFLPIHIYITYSWWCWYYINGIGSRPMIETYSFLAMPLALAFAYMAKRNWTKIMAIVLAVGFTILNIFQAYQYSLGVIWPEVMNKAYYWSTFGKTELDKWHLVEFDSGEPQPRKEGNVENILSYGFEDSTYVNQLDSLAFEGAHSYLLKGGVAAPEFTFTVEELGVQRGDYVRISAQCRKEKKEDNWYSMSLIVGKFEREGKVRRWRQARIATKLANPNNSLWGGSPGHWGEVSMYIKVPQNSKPDDTFTFTLVAGSGHPVYVDEMKVDVVRY